MTHTQGPDPTCEECGGPGPLTRTLLGFWEYMLCLACRTNRPAWALQLMTLERQEP
jgi:hypothetical protein